MSHQCSFAAYYSHEKVCRLHGYCYKMLWVFIFSTAEVYTRDVTGWIHMVDYTSAPCKQYHIRMAQPDQWTYDCQTGAQSACTWLVVWAPQIDLHTGAMIRVHSIFTFRVGSIQSSLLEFLSGTHKSGSHAQNNGTVPEIGRIVTGETIGWMILINLNIQEINKNCCDKYKQWQI
jgi:hypothetical protein